MQACISPKSICSCRTASWQAVLRSRTGLLCPQILNQLEQCKAFPDFNNYLAFIFAQADSLPIEVTSADLDRRHTAGCCAPSPAPLT